MADNTPKLPIPTVDVLPAHKTLTGALAVGASFTNGGTLSEVQSCYGRRFITARCLTATAGGTLAIAFVRPNATTNTYTIASGAGAGQINPAAVTTYATGGASAAVTAGAEQIVTATCNGEWYYEVTFTGSGAGTITWVDVTAV